jgi:hypothetical protein
MVDGVQPTSFDVYEAMFKTIEKKNYSISNELLNFAHTFCHTCKIHGYGLLYYNVLVLCV